MYKLELWGPLAPCSRIQHFFYHQFFSNPTIFTTNVYHRFYHKFYHKLLPLTTIIIGASISTTTPIFVPIQQFFNFTTHFTTHVTTIFTTNHYHYLHRPPQRFLYVRETHTNVLRGMQKFLLYPIREVKKIKNKHWMDLVHNGGGGVSGRVHFCTFFF